MRRFLAAWKCFLEAWEWYRAKYPNVSAVPSEKPLSSLQMFAMMQIASVEDMTPDMEEDIILICTGTAHARRYPAKKGSRGFRMEGGRG